MEDFRHDLLEQINNISQLSADMRFKVNNNDIDLTMKIESIKNWLKSIERLLKKEKEQFIEEQYDKMKDYIMNIATEEELKEHFNWYKIDNENRTDLLNTMFESYCNSYDNNELKLRINDLFL